MAEPRVHEPKLRALAAYARGQLRSSGRARLERHLATCALCRSALAGHRRYGSLLEDARAAAAPELPWARVELALQREAVRARRRARMRAAAPVAFAAAACVALFVAYQLRTPAPQPTAPVRPAPARAPELAEARPLSIRVSAVVGQVEAIDGEGARHAVDLDSVLREGWIVETGPASELHLVLEGSAAVLLAPEARLRLTRAREHDVLLALERGRVINAVRPLAPDGRYRVEAGGHEVTVRGTHFSVELLPDGLSVQVDEGWVSVLRGGAVVADLRAPQRWTLGGTVVNGVAEGARLVRPREPSPGFGEWPALHIPSWPRVVTWEIDSAQVSGAGELAMRVPPGDLDIVALLANGRRMRGHIRIDALGARFDPRGLEPFGPVSAARPAAAEVDPTQAAAVIRAAQPELQRCYERSLRNHPGGPQAARLRLQIDGRGRVQLAELTAAEDLPELLTECIRAVASRWQFAAPGGSGIAFEAPIRFQPRN